MRKEMNKAKPKASELTLDDLKAIIERIVKEEIEQYIENPYFGLKDKLKNVVKETEAVYVAASEKHEARRETTKPQKTKPNTIKISDLSVPDLECWISCFVQEALEEMLGDPDEGLEFTDEFIASLKEPIDKDSLIPLSEVIKKLGLE